MESLEADGRVDVHLEDLLGRVVGDVLDFHAPFGGGHDDGEGRRAVEEDGEVVLVVAAVWAFAEIGGLGKIDGLDLAAGFARLGGYKGVAEHRLGVFERLFLGRRELYAPLEAIGESALTAATRMNLGFHHDATSGVDLGEGAFEFGGGFDRHALGHGDAELSEQFFGLVFVNIHGNKKSASEGGVPMRSAVRCRRGGLSCRSGRIPSP